MADMVREYKLKPCPFCGGEAEINMIYGTYFVGCSNCHAGIIPIYEEMSLDKKVEEWNRRVNDG